ncbi:hypothetical protein C8R44DRAFT_751923 [Mycena epipterygia]|nr:hypothetical protein C8R44DRAFT_751923 [Mycena epipterygia]
MSLGETEIPAATRNLNEITDFLRTIRAGEDPDLKEFANMYAYLWQSFIEGRLDERSKQFRAEMTYLTGLGSIASFLALLQIGFIPIIGNPDCHTTPTPDGCDSHSQLLRHVMTLLSYVALSSDALGALLSLLTVRRLDDAVSRTERLMEQKKKLDDDIVAKVIQTFEISDQIPKTIQHLSTQVDRHTSFMEFYTRGQRGVVSFIMLGMLCFFAALIIQVVISQPRAIWITFILAVSIMASILLWEEVRAKARWPRAARAETNHHDNPGASGIDTKNRDKEGGQFYWHKWL